jgi:hypothetical protein
MNKGNEFRDILDSFLVFIEIIIDIMKLLKKGVFGIKIRGKKGFF